MTVRGALRRTGAALGAAIVVAAMTAVAAGAAAEDDLPSSMHGAVETQAVTAGVGALALLVDPGTAYAYSTLDRDDYGGGSVSYTMTARGANLNLGTIALAVLWAAPDCTEGAENSSCHLSGGTGGPNTGLHEAGGFPAYAEALYPPPPEETGQPSRERVYKCIVNKDAPGAAPTNGSADSACKSSDAVPMSAWAEAVGDSHSAKGFSRAAGFDAGVLKVGGSESRSDVRHAGKGKVVSEGVSAATDISLLGGQVTMRSAKASARVTGSADGSGDEQVACSFSGLTIAGQAVGIDDLGGGGAKPLLEQVEQATGFRVEVIPPTSPVAEVREGGKQVAECTGIRVNIVDVRSGSPVPVCAPAVAPDVPQCVPGLGNRFEFTFGKISVQQSVQDFDFDSLGSLGDVLDVGTDVATTSSSSASSSAFTPAPAGDVASLTPPAPSGNGGGAQVSGGSGTGRGTASASSTHGPSAAAQLAGVAQAGGGVARPNLALIGALTAGSSVGLIGGVVLLVYVVNSLAGRR